MEAGVLKQYFPCPTAATFIEFPCSLFPLSQPYLDLLLGLANIVDVERKDSPSLFHKQVRGGRKRMVGGGVGVLRP